MLEGMGEGDGWVSAVSGGGWWVLEGMGEGDGWVSEVSEGGGCWRGWGRVMGVGC